METSFTGHIGYFVWVSIFFLIKQPDLGLGVLFLQQAELSSKVPALPETESSQSDPPRRLLSEQRTAEDGAPPQVSWESLKSSWFPFLSKVGAFYSSLQF